MWHLSEKKTLALVSTGCAYVNRSLGLIGVFPEQGREFHLVNYGPLGGWRAQDANPISMRLWRPKTAVDLINIDGFEEFIDGTVRGGPWARKSI